MRKPLFNLDDAYKKKIEDLEIILIINKLVRRVWLIKRGEIMLEKNNEKMITEITNLVNEVKSNLTNEINKSIVYVYWNIGKIIVSNESEYNNRLEYALGGLSNNIFASTYTYYIPNKEQLISEVERVLNEEKN